MTVFVLTVTDATFDKKSAEVAHIARVLELAAASIQSTAGTKTSGTLIGTVPGGTTPGTVGSWTYTASGSIP